MVRAINTDENARRRALRRQWQRQLAELSHPAVEMTTEDFSPLISTFNALFAMGEAFDPALCILMRKLEEQTKDGTEDGDHDDADVGIENEEAMKDDGFYSFNRREQCSYLERGSLQPADRTSRREYVTASTIELRMKHAGDPTFLPITRPAPCGSEEWEEEQVAVAIASAQEAAEEAAWHANA